jgi:hypothetical protein
MILSGVRLSPLGTAATTGLLYQPQMIDGGDCGATSGMKIGSGNCSTGRKPAPAPLCPPQIPHDQTRARTRAAAMGSQRLTDSAMARSNCIRYTALNGKTNERSTGKGTEPRGCGLWHPLNDMMPEPPAYKAGLSSLNCEVGAFVHVFVFVA